jgi:hypothetical protein
MQDALKYLLDREAKQLEADRKLWAKELKQEEKVCGARMRVMCDVCVHVCTCAF